MVRAIRSSRHRHRELRGVLGQLAPRHPQPHVDLAPRLLEQALALCCGRLRDAGLLGAHVFFAACLQRRELRRQRRELLVDLLELRGRRLPHLRSRDQILTDLRAASGQVAGDRAP